MAAPTCCWADLTEQERQSCCGDPRDTLCCSLFAWEASGPLLSDWNNHIHTGLCNLVQRNYKRIYKRGGIHHAIVFKLYLLSQRNDPGSASPTVVIWTQSERTAGKVRKIILAHDLFARLGINFDVVFEKMDIRLCTDYDAHDRIQGDISLCGALVRIIPLEQPQTKECSYGTITSVIAINGSAYAMIPAHSLYPDCNDVDGLDANSDSDSSSSSAGASGYGIDSPISSFTGSSGSPDPYHIQPMAHSVYLERARSYSRPHSLDAGAHMVDVQRLIGHVGGSSPSSPWLDFGLNRDLDYALVKIGDESMILENRIMLPNGAEVSINRVFAGRMAPSGIVSIVTSTSGIQRSKIASTAAAVLLPWASKPTMMWQLATSIEPGDSGSAVVDDDGRLIGMAIASTSPPNSSFAVPMSLIFDHIAACFGVSPANISLDLHNVGLNSTRKNSIVEAAWSFGDVALTQARHSPDSSLQASHFHHSTDISYRARPEPTPPTSRKQERFRTEVDSKISSTAISPLPEPISTALPAVDTRNKHYIGIMYQMIGNDWSNAKAIEMSKSQKDLKRKVDKVTELQTLAQLTKMGPARRERIHQQAQHLANLDEQGDFWEPAFVEDLIQVKTATGRLRVTKFQVIYVRRPLINRSEAKDLPSPSQEESSLSFVDDSRSGVEQGAIKRYRQIFTEEPPQTSASRIDRGRETSKTVIQRDSRPRSRSISRSQPNTHPAPRPRLASYVTLNPNSRSDLLHDDNVVIMPGRGKPTSPSRYYPNRVTKYHMRSANVESRTSTPLGDRRALLTQPVAIPEVLKKDQSSGLEVYVSSMPTEDQLAARERDLRIREKEVLKQEEMLLAREQMLTTWEQKLVSRERELRERDVDTSRRSSRPVVVHSKSGPTYEPAYRSSADERSWR